MSTNDVCRTSFDVTHPLTNVCLLAALALPLAGQSKLGLVVSSEVVPAGSTAQFKVYAAAPSLIAAGVISMDFEPLLFGDIKSISVFSATGDQIGYANVKGRHVDAHFSSSSGGIGQLPGVPVMIVNIPVLATSFPGVMTPVTLAASGFKDAFGDAYDVSVTPGRLTVRPNVLSVESVIPGGGVLPEGTVVAIRGAGFRPDTRVTIDGVAIREVQYFNAEQMNITLAGAMELTGKRVRVTNPGSEPVNYFAALPSNGVALPQGFRAVEGVHPILPLATYTNMQTPAYMPRPYNPFGVAMLNPGTEPVKVTFEGAYIGTENVIVLKALDLAPGALAFVDVSPMLAPLNDPRGSFWISASAPVRMMLYKGSFAGIPSAAMFPSLRPSPPPAVQLNSPASPGNISFSVQKGKRNPDPVQVSVGGGADFTVSVPAQATWLSVTPSKGTAPAKLTIAATAPGMAAGTYTAAVTITPIVPADFPGATAVVSTVMVTLTISDDPLLEAIPQNCCFFFAPGETGSSPPETLTVTTNGDPAPFRVVSTPPWARVTPASGTTPATLTIGVSPRGLADATYLGNVEIAGPSNSVSVPLGFFVLSPPAQPQPPSAIQFAPTTVSLVFESGAGPLRTPVVVTLHPSDIAITTQTDSGGDWLMTQVFSNPAQAVIWVNAKATNLGPGIYTAAITVTSGTLAPVKIPVTLTVLAAPTESTRLIAPASVLLDAPQGTAVSNQFTLQSEPGPVLFTASLAAPGAGMGLTVEAPYQAADFRLATPATMRLSTFGDLPSGLYRARIALTWATGSLKIPVMLNVRGTGYPPVISAIVDGISMLPGPIAPGEVITVFGTGLDEVLINGEPANVLYSSSTQVNAVVPNDVRFGTATIQGRSNGAVSATWVIPSDSARQP